MGDIPGNLINDQNTDKRICQYKLKGGLLKRRFRRKARKMGKRQMRAFDLRLGDIIRAQDFILGGRTRFEVVTVSRWIFEGRRLDNGMVRGFIKTDYQRGKIRKARLS